MGGVAISKGDSDGDVLTATDGHTRLANMWIIDSGCSYYVCPTISWFHTYGTILSGVIALENDD